MPVEARELEENIRKDPDNDLNYLVYGDWLLEMKDFRGDLIAAQGALLRRPDDVELQKRVGDLLELHRDRLLGPVAKCLGKQLKHLDWHLGFLRGARVGFEYDDDADQDETINALLDLHSARFLRHLTLGPAKTQDYMNLGRFVTLLTEEVRPRLLRELYLGARDDYGQPWDISSTGLGDVSSLYESFPDLTKLELEAGEMTLGDIVLPRLRRFGVYTGGLTAENLRSIANAKWPLLESLDLWFGNPGYGASGGLEDIRRILDGTGLDALKHLGLENGVWADELAAALPGSKILPRLETLDLSMGCLSDAGAQTLAAHPDSFRHLKRLDLSKNCLTEEGTRLLANFVPGIIMYGQEPDRIYTRQDGTERRYPMVGE